VAALAAARVAALSFGLSQAVFVSIECFTSSVNFSVALCAKKLKIGRIVSAAAAHLDDVMHLKNDRRAKSTKQVAISQASPAKGTTIFGKSSDQVRVDFALRLAVLIRFRDPSEPMHWTTD
jgi:hypothetical protein